MIILAIYDSTHPSYKVVEACIHNLKIASSLHTNNSQMHIVVYANLLYGQPDVESGLR